jgi:REP element-mobilizing transposase RayT
MPNHVHGIVILNRSQQSVGARHASPLRTQVAGPTPRSLGAIVGSFKAAVIRELRIQGLWSDEPLWQRNYYERLIRDDTELTRAREYVINNPIAWQFDKENPARSISKAHQDNWAWLESGG